MNFIKEKSKILKSCETPRALQGKKGYALLLSVLISGLILAIGLGLLSIVEKKTTLSSLGRESQKAFYAADSGGECALYWDRKHVGFSTSVFATSTDFYPPSNGITAGVVCNGIDIAANGEDQWEVTDVTGTEAKTTFVVSFANGTCATVEVLKTNQGRSTTLLTRGHNTCDLSSPKVVERAIRIAY